MGRNFQSRLSRGSFQPARARRASEWAILSSGAPVAVPGATAVLFFAFNASIMSNLVPCTLVRIRGEIFWQTDGGAAGEAPAGAFGITRVKLPALAAGIGSIPTPITEGESDNWQMWEPLQCSFRGVEDPLQSVIKTVDVKAMRKFVDGDGIAGVVENGSVAAQGANFNFQGRFLFLLH